MGTGARIQALVFKGESRAQMDKSGILCRPLCPAVWIRTMYTVFHGKHDALVLIAAELTLLEYIAGIFLLKAANVRLWDYSMMWGNVNGLICPLFTLFWTLLGVMYYYLIHPHILEALAWLASNLAFSFFIGVFFGVFSIDVAYSINLVTRIREFADEKEIVVKYEEFKRITYEKRKEQKDKIRFFMSLPRRERMNEMLEHYRLRMEELEKSLNR